MKDREVRIFNSEMRATTGEDGVSRVHGIAAVYESETELWPGFFEKIERGFFDGVMGDDVRALKNHDTNLVLGRTKPKTLRIWSDEVGLAYEYLDPGTTYSNDLLKSITRGDVDQSSFAFSVKEGGDKLEKMERNGRTVYLRTLKSGGAEQLFDVSPVTFPAYQDTTVAKRSMESLIQEQRELEPKKASIRRPYWRQINNSNK